MLWKHTSFRQMLPNCSVTVRICITFLALAQFYSSAKNNFENENDLISHATFERFMKSK